MQESKETKNGEKIHYSVQIVSEGTQGVSRHFSASGRVLIAFLAGVAFLIIAMLSYCVILAGELSRSKQYIEDLTVHTKELEKQNEMFLAERGELSRENEELQEKVAILSDTVNNKVQKEREREAEIAQAYVPTGFPLKGTASYNENDIEFEGNPIAMFHASQGTSVVATASGTVSAIVGDVQVGYIVMIDHGNGYFTVYRNKAMPEVKEGEEVTTTTKLFQIEAGNETLGYQIIENNQYINPLNLMETYG